MNFISNLIPLLVLISHIGIAIFFLGLLFVYAGFINRKGTIGKLYDLIAVHSLPIVFLISLAGVAGSLYYSEIIGFPPCVLCWWQRVFLYPITILSGMGFLKRDKQIIDYAIVFALIAFLIGLYQYIGQFFTGILPCDAAGVVSCSKIYVSAYGYITIPLMALTLSVMILAVLVFAAFGVKRSRQ